ncbi:MAG TPA: type 2 lanthipeptide synthetase LanM family protein [Pseudonocardiaceae bacterium]|nr:type 2 lanthipeptide synthetase LanM family protein [Pseudonocardiaceae bacterium]
MSGSVADVNDSASSATGFAGLLGSTWWTLGHSLRERAAGDMALPDWADFVERAVARAVDNAAENRARPEDRAQRKNPAGFESVFAALVDSAADDVTFTGADVDGNAIEDEFRTRLGERLAKLATRTLVTELHLARADGRLSGATSELRFADFVRTTATGRGLARLFGDYPVLARILGTACLHAIDAHREILSRFGIDRPMIVARLLDGADPGLLVAIEPGSGDYHRRGRSVALLEFANGSKIVYKPRSLALQAHFDELVGWLNNAVPWLELRTVTSVPRGEYGWQEFISYRPCTELAEVDAFYQRQGALLALINALDGTDIHHENVIAVADQPVLIDIETLFHPTLLPPAATGPDPAMRALMSSVHRTAMLPTLVVGEHGVLDMSGVGGDRDRTYPQDKVDVADAGTDRMRIVRTATTFAGSSNRPRIDGIDAVPEAHTNALIAGFRAAYDAIARGGAELLAEDGPVRRCAADEMRIVVRPTRMYGTLLAESTHPDVLRDALDREELFGLLASDANDELAAALTPHEIADLWAGDVPIFLGRPGSRQVRTSTGATVTSLLDRTGLASATAKIGRMGEADRRDQEWVIRASLASRAEPNEHESGAQLTEAVTAILPDPEQLLSSACAIADEIVARAMHDEHRANWLTMDQIDGRHWMVLPMGAGLGCGYSGVALFLGQLGALTGITRYTDLARKAMRPIPALIDAVDADPALAQAIGCGGFLGLGGISYALARLATLLGDADLMSSLERIVPLVGQADDGAQFSIAAGQAGGLASMLAVHAETGLAEAKSLAADFAARLADPLLSNPDAVLGDRLPTTGFEWGDTGVGWALLRYGAGDGGQRFTELGRAALARDPGPDLSLAQPERDLSAAQPGRDLGRDPSAAQPGRDLGPDLSAAQVVRDYSWCSGLAGRLLGRAADRPIAADDPWLALFADRPMLRDMSLCHGELGVLNALLALGGLPAAMAERGAAYLLGALERFGPACALPSGVSGPGLLTGLAGIGYGLLRLGMPAQVPSVLLFEPTVLSPETSHPE